jgi:predicted DNA-binding transcriptional regulator AlpA
MGRRKNCKNKNYKLSSGLATAANGEHFAGLDRVVSENEAAAIIGYSKDTLRREFKAGRAPARVRLSGRRIGYRLSAIYAFLEAQTEKPSAP